MPFIAILHGDFYNRMNQSVLYFTSCNSVKKEEEYREPYIKKEG